MVHLGPFRLERIIGKGAMAAVWRGVHRDDGTPVAIKVLSGGHAVDPTFHRAFRNEVRAVASLDHPHIVSIYDHGTVDRAAHLASEKALGEGAPWLVMELVEGGTLSRSKLDWKALRGVALSLLDALAHAHARGVIHRDIKPANVMIDASGAVKLTDFGLAHAVSGDQGHLHAGTPSYMAPEQFFSEWRDYGPWTDLYAFGCLVYKLLNGSPPFGNDRTWAGFQFAHCLRPAPPLEPRIPVPTGLEDWIARLLAKDTGDRYRRAADAASGLLALDAESTSEYLPILVTPDAETVVLPALSEAVTVVTTEPPRPPPSSDEPDYGLKLCSHAPRRTAVPPAWKRGRNTSGIRLRGVGLGLYGLRTIPLVDREVERDALWRALTRVQRQVRAELVTLHGPGGTGKTRLATWLSQRAHEVGVGASLLAPHQAVAGPDSGLPAMVHAIFRTAGIEDEALEPRLEGVLGDAEAAGRIARLLRGERGAEGPGERYAAIYDVLSEICRERVAIVHLDDLHWGLEAARFAEWVLDRQESRPLPILLVATVVDEALADAPDARAVLDGLAARPDARWIEVGALPEQYRIALVRELIGLEGEVAGRVEARAAGNPLFAIQLVGDWIEQGLLVPGEGGFVLRAGARAEPPADLLGVWSERLERALGEFSDPAAQALELAAVLGQQVDASEWRDACAVADTPASEALVEHLLDLRLLRPTAQGYRFAHGLLVEVLEARARARSRLARHHDHCATILEHRRAGGWPHGLAERLGRHLEGAGRSRDAADPMLRGARERFHSGDYGRAEAAVAEREAALVAAGMDETDPAIGEGRLLRAEMGRVRGNYALMEQWLDKIDAHSARDGWEQIRVRAGTLRGGFLRVSGQIPQAVATLREAEALALDLGDPAILAEVRWWLGEALTYAGFLDLAGPVLQQALDEHEALGDRHGAARAFQSLAELEKLKGHHRRALELIEQARERYERDGVRWGVASTVNSAGDVHRYLGEASAAAACYTRAAQLFRAIGSESVAFPEYNQALLNLESGDIESARELLLRSYRGFQRIGGRAVLGDVHIALAGCDGAVGAWEAFDEHVDQAIAIIAECACMDEDTARVAETAAQLTLDRDPARATRLYEIARAQWEAIGRPEDAALVTARIPPG